jgi:hypothetical protein
MSAHPASSRPARKTPASRPEAQQLQPDDQLFNDQVNALLRDAAAEREARTLAADTEDVDSARRQFDAVVKLSRARPGKTRR